VTVRALIVFALLAAIIVPVVLAEMRRLGPRRPARPAAVRAPKREAGAKPPLRLVVNKNDMDRELADLLAKDSRKGREPDE
jgi:predicted lipid-binding transport protein (Tim44 family)